MYSPSIPSPRPPEAEPEAIPSSRPPRPDSGRPPPPAELESIRREIDRLDLSLLDLLHRRLALAGRAAGVRSAHALGSTDHAREAALVRRAASLARERGLDPEIVREIFWKLIALSHRSAREGGTSASGDGRPGGRP